MKANAKGEKEGAIDFTKKGNSLTLFFWVPDKHLLVPLSVASASACIVLEHFSCQSTHPHIHTLNRLASFQSPTPSCDLLPPQTYFIVSLDAYPLHHAEEESESG